MDEVDLLGLQTTNLKNLDYTIRDVQKVSIFKFHFPASILSEPNNAPCTATISV